MNVGASRPEDAGLYFSWGNIEGVSADDAAAVAAMTQAAYDNTPGASVNRDLVIGIDDAASAIMGNTWCMPDIEDIQELIDECNWEWVTINGVNGYRVSSKQPGNTNSIFLPATGSIFNGLIQNVNLRGDYWASTFESATFANTLVFGQDEIKPWQSQRYLGFCIRARIA